MSRLTQVEKSAPGIWQYHHYFPPVPKKFWLSLGEGDTPEDEREKIIFKREDLNPTGSLKDRGMAYQISRVFSQGKKDLVLSSSGNAAIAAAAYAKLTKIKMHIFTSFKITAEKLMKIKKCGAKVILTKRPVSEAIRYSQKNDFLNLRPSTTDDGFEGYKSLAFEIDRNLGKIDSIFIPVSSGTALLGMAEGYKILGYLPKLHIVQTSAICPLARYFDKDYRQSKTSLADALVSRVVPRKNKILKLVEDSRGSGWVVSDGQIKKAQKRLESYGIETSAEGACALAAIFKAKTKGFKLGEKVVCLLTGRKY